MKLRIASPQHGLSLVELMISITLGMLILLALITIFVNNNRTQTEIEKNNRQLENGRYALQLIANDLRTAGYFDTYLPSSAPASVPDPCAIDLATLETAMAVHVQGYNNSNGGLSCISDVKTDTDVLVVRHAASCRSANPQDANCDSLTDGPAYLQVSGCETDATEYVLSNTAANFTLTKPDCTNAAPVSKLRTHVYFIANNNTSGDGVPTLKRAELSSNGGAIAFTVVPLVDGIESMQLLYGTMSSAASPTSAAPTSYVTAPTTAAGWWTVTAVNVSLLSRNESTSLGYTDTKTYDLSGTSLGPFSDGYRRHVHTSTVFLSNPAGRRL